MGKSHDFIAQIKKLLCWEFIFLCTEYTLIIILIEHVISIKMYEDC